MSTGQLAFGDGGAYVRPPSDAKTQALLRELFPCSPCWRFGAILSADRKARQLRAENAKRHEAWFARAGLTGEHVV